MKILALFDKGGKIQAILHPPTKRNAPVIRFQPQVGQRAAELEGPAELEKLKPKELHESVRVDMSSGSPRLVTRLGSKKRGVPLRSKSAKSKSNPS